MKQLQLLEAREDARERVINGEKASGEAAAKLA